MIDELNFSIENDIVKKFSMREDCSKKNFDDFFENEIVDDFVNEIFVETIDYNHDVEIEYISIVFARE